MKTKKLLLSTLFLLGTVAGLQAGGEKAVTISAFDTMKFDVTKIEAHPGEKITVTLKNSGTVPKEAMGHNWVLLKAGVDPLAYSNAAIAAKSQDYQPKEFAKQVLAAIKTLGPNESASVTFTAPSQPGSYNYLCSFPAHCSAGMKGVLVVK